jgi:hypothetical protein
MAAAHWIRLAGFLVTFAAAAAAAGAQPVTSPTSAIDVQDDSQALAQDAAQYAQRHVVSLPEAVRRLEAQEASAAVTDRIGRALRHRLAGISIEHGPQYRVVVLLTGQEPVVDQSALAAGSPVPVVFRLGAYATRDQIVSAMRTRQLAMRASFPNARGMGLDARTGELVLLVSGADADQQGTAAMRAHAESLTGVPVRVEIADRSGNMVRGGGRVEGLSATDGKRYACTTGFVVGSGLRTGVVTAAHCPDTLVYRDLDGSRVPLDFVGAWGAHYQDVQLHESSRAEAPLFYADRRAGALRRVTGARSRAGTRVGDVVCHWGESSGYSCSEVKLVDFAPPGDLCAGPCEPVWVAVAGSRCVAGDSGGPVFSGTVAFGIVKGGSWSGNRCNLYFYMSTDFLPDGWSLLREQQPPARSEATGRQRT